MKFLKIPFIKAYSSGLTLTEISLLLHKTESHRISYAPWQKALKTPDVSFSIAYTDHAFYLKYWVEENDIVAKYRENNDPVYKDSCVEFFIAFEGDQNYYNLEFNSLGTVYAAYGTDKENRTVLPKKLLENIRSETLITNSADPDENGVVWEIILSVPMKTFLFNQLQFLSNKTCRINFFKCGDELPEPHFLCWNNIVNDIPNFHLPEYFGLAEFA